MPLKDRIVGRLYDAKRAMRARRLEKYKEECAGPMVSHRVVVDMSVGIGNAVEATPMVQALRSLWPRAHMTLVAPIGDMFSDWCIVDRAVGSWDDVADEAVEDVFLPWFAEAPDNVSGDVHRAMRAFPDYLLRPEREVNMDLARELGYRGDTPPLFVAMREPASPPPAAARRISIAACSKHNHRWRNKLWAGYPQLVRALLERYDDAQICIVGKTAEDFPGTPPDDPRVLDLRGRVSLAETAWLLRNSDLAIGNDCGPMHIADAVLAPSLVLFGPTCEIKNGPRNRGVPISIGVDCSPCQYDLQLLDSCDEPKCMTGLSVAMVLDQVERVLGC